MIRPLLGGKEVLEGVLTKEEERVKQAIDKCLEGKQVALVSSGDSGIYGLASLALEMLHRENADTDVWVVPGISALNAASALLGAPLNHDFCTISLSDLLTPWPLVERRIEAAGSADFNVVFFNPKSEKRDWQLQRAVEILLRYRPGETPVGIVRNAFRKGQMVQTLELKDLASASLDMLCTVVVGNSTTQRWKNWIFTPRGYLSRGGEENRKSPPYSSEGEAIIDQSFRMIQQELGPHHFTHEELAVVTRVIHATGDFTFASLIRFQNGFFDRLSGIG
jgi:precorrin-3B C17-methyltransferase